MTTDRRSMILAIGTGLYLLGLGFLCGVVANRIAFDQHRTAVLRHYNSAIAQWHAYRMALEKSVLSEPPPRSARERMAGDDAAAWDAPRPSADRHDADLCVDSPRTTQAGGQIHEEKASRMLRQWRRATPRSRRR